MDRIQRRSWLGTSEDKRDFIRLDQFLKLRGVAGSGGQAKVLIQDGQVTVNGDAETRRGRKLRTGDVVAALGEELVVDSV
jgi:ribosome-associated protein